MYQYFPRHIILAVDKAVHCMLFELSTNMFSLTTFFLFYHLLSGRADVF